MKDALSGLIVVNKPLHLSSMDVVRVLRKLTGIRKIGHAGTLDPLATGVLLVCIGRVATKHIDKLMNTEKEYCAWINLSMFSVTDDAEGPFEDVIIEKIPSRKDIDLCLQRFIGLIAQVPPHYSAIKIEGVRAYEMARQGEMVELKPRNVLVLSIEVLSYEWPLLQIRVVCGKGFYVRSLARDIGVYLNTGGYLTSLERIRIDNYSINEAEPLNMLQENKEIITSLLIQL